MTNNQIKQKKINAKEWIIMMIISELTTSTKRLDRLGKILDRIGNANAPDHLIILKELSEQKVTACDDGFNWNEVSGETRRCYTLPGGGVPLVRHARAMSTWLHEKHMATRKILWSHTITVSQVSGHESFRNFLPAYVSHMTASSS